MNDIFAYMKTIKNQLNVGKYTSLMDGMGLRHPNTKRGRCFGKIVRPSLETLERIKKDRFVDGNGC